MFGNGSDFKLYFTPLLKGLDIKHVSTTIKKPLCKDPEERVHQVISNMCVTKDIDNKVFCHIYIWGETLASIAWVTIDSYCHTIMYTPGQDFFGRYMIFNLVSVVYWIVVTSVKQRQVYINNI